MVFHLLRYRLKCFLRDRQMLFWTMAFPLLLATLFHLAFSNLMNIDQFSEIPVAVVDTAEYRENVALQSALASVSSDEGLFDLQVVSLDVARDQLQNETIEGFILCDPAIRLNVKKSGLNQSIIRQFLDDYNQTVAAYQTILQSDPNALQNGLIDELEGRRSYARKLPISQNAMDPAVIYFFSLIAMAALYGGFWGMRVISELQADLSPQGARVNLAPVHKLTLLMTDIGAVFVIQFSILLIVIVYITQVLKHSFGQQTGYVVLTAAVGSFVGISMGACIAALVKKGEGAKTGVLIASSMVMTFLSGMMYHGIKYWVSHTLPILAWINPANLITDAFYALYYYDTLTRFTLNLAILLAFGVIFCLLTYRIIRRQNYASL